MAGTAPQRTEKFSTRPKIPLSQDSSEGVFPVAGIKNHPVLKAG